MEAATTIQNNEEKQHNAFDNLPAGALVLANLENRQRDRKEINLRRLVRTINNVAKEPVSYEQVLSVFKTMENAGLGSLIVGRGTKGTRFKRNYSLKKVVESCKNGISEDQIATATSPASSVTASKKPRKVKLLEKPIVADDVTEIIVMHGKELKKISIEGKRKSELFETFLKLL